VATTYNKNKTMTVEESPMITWGKIEEANFLGIEKGGYKVPQTS
jgi:hypothetical protein